MSTRSSPPASIAENSLTPDCPLLVTCEHATPRVPARWDPLFDSAGGRDALCSHRGWDPGAAVLARALSESLGAPLLCGVVSRLLIELNRSEDAPDLWSEFSQSLDAAERACLLDSYYFPYRQRVRSFLAPVQSPGTSLHLSVHTFTPLWHGQTREMDVGLLFDPSRPLETETALQWAESLRRHLPQAVVRLNEPYRGTDDGLTTSMRQTRPDPQYLGLELEVNQGWVLGGGKAWDDLVAALAFTAQSLPLWARMGNTEGP